MEYLNKFLQPTRWHLVNGLIHGVIVNLAVIILFLTTNWVGVVAETTLPLMPLAAILLMATLASMIGAGYVPSYLYQARFLTTEVEKWPGNWYEYMAGVIFPQYIGWGMLFLEFTHRAQIAEMERTHAFTLGEPTIPWLLLAGMFPMVLPVCGAMFSLPGYRATSPASATPAI